MLSGEKTKPIVNKSLHKKNKEAKEGQKQVNTLEVEESKFNMVQPMEKETKQTDNPLSYAAVTKNTKGSLPPNVIRTRGNSTVSRFGVKIRYSGCPLRIGSAYCSPEDADKVASVFRKSAQVDSKGNIFLDENLLKKYNDMHANRYLPFTTTQDRIQVVSFLSGWLINWKKKMKKKKKKKRNRSGSAPSTTNMKKDAADKKKTNNKRIKKKKEVLVGKKKPSSTSNKPFKSSSVLDKHLLNAASPFKDTSSGDNKYKQRQQQVTGINVFARNGGRQQQRVEDKRNEMCSGSSSKRKKDFHENGETDVTVDMIKAVLSVNGLHQTKNEEQRDGYTVHEWQSNTLEVLFSVKSLLHANINALPFSGVSSQSNSTEEEENDSSSAYVSSDADNPTFANFNHFDEEFDGLSDMHIDQLVPSSIEKYSNERHDVNCYSLITVNGMWDSDVISHGILEKVDSETGSVLEEKQIDTLHGSERQGTSAYFAINLKDFAISKYKFKLVAKDLYHTQVGESNNVDFEIRRPSAHSSNKNLKAPNSDNNNGDKSDNNNNNNDNNNNNNIDDNNDKDSNNNNNDRKFEKYQFSGSNSNKRRKFRENLDVFNADIELGKPTSQLGKMLSQKMLPLFQFSNQFSREFMLAISILLVFLCCPNSSRGMTFKTDPHLQGSFSVVEKIGFFDLSTRACSLFMSKATCSEKIAYLSVDKSGLPLVYGPNDYFSKVRDPIPLASKLETITLLLVPLSCYFLLLSHFTEPYKRDRMSSKITIFLAITEMIYYYCEGYAMIFSMGHFISIFFILGMEQYIHRNWSIEKYAKYRLEYYTFFTFVLYLCHLTIRPWVVKHYGNNEVVDMPIVTTMFAPMCQRMFGQNLPVLLSVKKGPVSLMWFPYLLILGLLLSTATALSINSCNAYTIFQLWPYYVAPYFVAFSIATGIKYLRIPTLLRYVLDENSQLAGWYF